MSLNPNPAPRATTPARRQQQPRAKRWLNIFITVQLVSFAWIFFRAHHISDALTLVHRLFSTPR